MKDVTQALLLVILLRLASNSTDVSKLGKQYCSAVDNNEDGLVTADTYLGVFYPEELQT